MYGHQLIRTYEAIHALGLTESQKSFSIHWCGKGEDLLRDYRRRDGATARVDPRTVALIRERLAEAASLLPAEVAAQLHEVDAAIVRDCRVADLLGRQAMRRAMDR